MKIAKVMLLSVAVFAVVGGALAFKSQATFLTKYCVGTADGVNTDVPTFSGAHKFTIDPLAPSLLYRTTNAAGAAIAIADDCEDLTTTTTSSTRITAE